MRLSYLRATLGVYKEAGTQSLAVCVYKEAGTQSLAVTHA